MKQSPMVQPTISIQRTSDGKWRCLVPRSSTQFLIPYLRRHRADFTTEPTADCDQFEFPKELTLDHLKTLLRGFGAHIPRPGEKGAEGA